MTRLGLSLLLLLAAIAASGCASRPIECAAPSNIDGGARAGCGPCGCTEQCQPVACALYCANGFAKDAHGCEICACNPPPACPPEGGICPIVNGACPGYDANGCACLCPEPPPPPRQPVESACIRSTDDPCTTDADCKIGGCSNELCYNPAVSSGATLCDCPPPGPLGCGCVAGKCSFYQ